MILIKSLLLRLSFLFVYLIQALVPLVLLISLPSSPQTRVVLDSQEWTALSEKLLSEHNASLFVYSPPEGLIGIHIHYPQEGNPDTLKGLVVAFLTSKQVSLTSPEKAVSRVASFSNIASARTTSYDSFAHFNSKLLPQKETPPATSSNYSLFDDSRGTFDHLEVCFSLHRIPNKRTLHQTCEPCLKMLCFLDPLRNPPSDRSCLRVMTRCLPSLLTMKAMLITCLVPR